MSEFLAEALVVVKPDTSKFRAELEAQLRAIKVTPISVPIIAAGAGLAAAASATAGLVAAQKAAEATGLGLASTETLVNRAVAQGIPLLEARSVATAQLAGAQAALDAANKRSTAGLLGAGTGTARLNSALLGLRTAVGSAAVIGLGALAVGAIAAGKAIRGMVLATAALEAELNTFRAVTGATAEEMDAVSKAALQLGADVSLPAVTAGDAAIALTELAKAGLTVQDALAGVEGVLQLATAAQISNAEAAKIAANALNSFGLAGEETTRVADLFANAANAAQGSVTDIGIAFQQASAVARQVGLSLEDTTSILSLFAKNGLQGSDAGTSLRVALIRLVAPTKAAAAEIEKLGLDIRDASGAVRADVFAQFGEATRNLTPALRDASAALIFGQDAIRAVSIGAREGTEGLRLMQFEIDQTGTAAEVAGARTEGFSGAVEGLNSSLTTLGITFGGPINRTLAAFARGATTATDGINKLASALGRLFEEAATPPDDARDFFGDVSRFARDAIGPIERIREGFRGSIDVIDSGALSAAQKLRLMNKELQNLESARIAAERGGQRGVADQLTKEIEGLRAEIKALKADSKGITASVSDPLREALGTLERVRAQKIILDVDTTGIDRLIRSLRESIPITEKVEGNIARLRDDFGDLGSKARDGASGVDALTKALADLGRQAGQAQADLLRLQTEGGTPQQQIAVLRDSEQIQRDIIEALKKDGNQPGDASAIEKARNQIKSDQGQIESLQNEIASDAKALATAAEKAQKEREDAFKRVLAAQLLPKERLLVRAGATEGLRDDIKFREAIVKMLKGQIDQIRKTLGNTQEAQELISAIQDRILDEVNKIKKDRQDFRKALRDALEERLERAQRGTELDIELADINENTKRRINLRLRLIAQLKKEAKALHLQGNALKENRNERARIRAEIDAILKEGKDDKSARQKAAEFFFEQLQAQQGFAANLLGNLITGPTAGLVGVPSTTSAIRPERGVAAVSLAQEGKQAAGVSAGQANTTNDILLRILRQLRQLNGATDAPEAIIQKKSSNAIMDGIGGV